MRELMQWNGESGGVLWPDDGSMDFGGNGGVTDDDADSARIGDGLLHCIADLQPEVCASASEPVAACGITVGVVLAEIVGSSTAHVFVKRNGVLELCRNAGELEWQAAVGEGDVGGDHGCEGLLFVNIRHASPMTCATADSAAA